MLHQCDGCAFSLEHWGSWLGYQNLPAREEVSSRSWLPIVEAPGCLGHLAMLWLKKRAYSVNGKMCLHVDLADVCDIESSGGHY